jgi:hypothetical protein
MSACDLPRRGDMREVAPQPLPLATIDLEACSVLEITTYLFEHEKAGHRFDSWPAEVQARVEAIVLEWRNKNTDREVCAFSSAVVVDKRRSTAERAQRNAVLVIHHAPRG